MLKPVLILALVCVIRFASCDNLLFGGVDAAADPNPLCPDKQGRCPTKSTCCPTTSGKYGCCPLQGAVCCADLVHCCPSGFKCDSSTGACTNGAITTDWLHRIAPAKSPQPGQGLKQQQPTKRAGLEFIVCPKGKVQCPSSSTCCMLSGDVYGCCPLPSAVCCRDHEHCCPQGYACGQNTCTKTQGQGSTKFLQIVSGQSKEEDELPKENINPKFNLKKLEEDKDDKEDGFSVVCPGGQFQCSSGSTCCKDPQGKWGCCPFVKATCCTDGVHCCREHETCNLASQRCDKDNGETGPLHYKTQAEQVDLNTGAQALVGKKELQCPDKISSCPQNTTCCKMKNGYYGCCQYDQAICCSDFIHCCPPSMNCNTTAGTCYNNQYTLEFGKPWSERVAVNNELDRKKNDIKCPGGKSSCPEDTTCCALPSGGYGCCPYANAKCCSDKVHCCPSNEECDEKKGECVHSKTGLRSMWGSKSTAKVAYEDVVCPDQHTSCSDNATCCAITGSEYGCCPLPNAVCCTDGQHCCPQDYTCHTSTGQCIRGSNPVHQQQSHQANDPDTRQMAHISQKQNSDVFNVVCPDMKSACPNNSTCCQLATGQYACCPHPNAVCCSDHTHCCPASYTCDVAQGKCNPVIEGSGQQVPWVTKVPAREHKQKEKMNVTKTNICPDKRVCAADYTCCEMMTGGYGCCPLPNAVCCSDELHCCPTGLQCDVKAGHCLYKQPQLTQMSKLSASDTTLRFSPVSEVIVNDVVCPDQKSKCTDKQSCCPLSSGDYGCCPLPNAVCCADKQHCCPHASTCDAKTGMCQSSYSNNMAAIMAALQAPKTASLDWQHLQQSKDLVKKVVNDIICPDHTSQCSHDKTCCETLSGDYGCCALPAATCCADKIHCCPHKTTCNMTAGTCDHKTKLELIQISWNDQDNKIVSKEKVSDPNINLIKMATSDKPVNDIVCPDKKSQCNHDKTCCMTPSGDYGCCPLPAATCCADKIHCCPHKTICNTTAGTCEKMADNGRGLVSVGWDGISLKTNDVKDIVCPDKKSQCSHDKTCCMTQTGDYGCCPLPAATCCADKIHCCPHKTICNTTAGTCDKMADNGRGLVSVGWNHITSQKLTSEDRVTDHPCGDGKSSCGDNQTCCKTLSGDYGCCNYPNGVCCTDNIHCCPHATTCNLTQKSCDKNLISNSKNGGGSLSIDWDVLQGSVKKEHGSKEEDASMQLQEHYDHLPNTLPFLQKTAAVPAGTGPPEADMILCPDRQHECPSYSTCCRMSSQWGCCPSPRAVCCADRQHCCPFGYKCDPHRQQCSKTRD